MTGVRLELDEARDLGQELLVAYGAPRRAAETVVSHLVEADMSGVASHGLIRLPQYVEAIEDGEINPTGVPAARAVNDTMVVVDGARGFGQVAVEVALTEVEKVVWTHGMGIAVVRNTGHAGRMGAYAEALGRKGLLALVACSSPVSGHMVVPYKGRQGRLATNPISFAIPSLREPIVGDFSTAAMPEGRVRRLRNEGLPVPEEVLLDCDGVGTTDPNALYTEPRGAIMPFGGIRQGYRGFALALFVEALATLLASDSTSDPRRFGNNVAVLAVQVEEGFAGRSEALKEYVCSAAPVNPAEPVVLPGEPEQWARASAKTITVDDRTWREIGELVGRKRLHLPGQAFGTT